MQQVRGFETPIFVTRPLLPNLDGVMHKLQDVWESKWLTNNGKQHQLLEQQLQQVLKVPNLSLFNNGTIALMAAIKILDLQGEVITTPFTFAATTHSIALNNLAPVFCDIDPVTMNIDPEKIEKAITPNTSAILGVHVFGNPCDVKRIQELANRYQLKVIYDAAHAFNTEINGVGIGNFGDISMFSFHATKLFNTIEGGALSYTSDKLKDEVEQLRNFGIVNEGIINSVGLNGKLNEVQAVIGQLVLQLLDEERVKRKVLLEKYIKCLRCIDGIQYFKLDENVIPSLQYFVIRINEAEFGLSRDQVHEEFKKFNVFTRKYFFPLCSNFDCYSKLPSATLENLPVANHVSSEVLSMPFYGELTEEDVEKICLILENMNRKILQ